MGTNLEDLIFMDFQRPQGQKRGAPIRVHNVLCKRHRLRHVNLQSLSPHVQACAPMYFHGIHTKIDALCALTPSPTPRVAKPPDLMKSLLIFYVFPD